jgi:hypothetical protein
MGYFMLFDRLPPSVERAIGLTTAVATAAIGLTACGGSGPEHPLKRCYDKPLASQEPADANEAPIKLQEDPQGVMSGDPQKLSPYAQTTLLGAQVKVTRKTAQGRYAGYGSGFLTEVNGTEMVITNAHVVGDPELHGADGDLDAISVIDWKGESTGVVAGCYIYEDSAKGFARFVEYGAQPSEPPHRFTINPNEPGIDKDVAALVLQNQHFGDSRLALHAAGPQRGTWDAAINLGTFSDTDVSPQKPNVYNVMPVGPKLGNLPDCSYYVISGLERFLRKAGAVDYSAPGASGGAVVTVPSDPNKPPLVDGIDKGGYRAGLDPKQLNDLFRFSTTPINENQEPDVIVPASIIAKAEEIAIKLSVTGTYGSASPTPSPS